MDQLLFWLVPAASVLALCFAWYFHRQMMKESEGTPQMVKIAAAVRKGAMSYLRQRAAASGGCAPKRLAAARCAARQLRCQNAR